MKEIEEMTIAVDAETVQAVSAICKVLGTTIEILFECFVRFSTDPNNFHLLQSFAEDEATHTEADAASRIVVDTVFRMAMEETLRRGSSDTSK